MIQRVTLDLSVAHPESSPAVFTLGAASWVRFQSVPGPVNVRIERTGASIPVTQGMTIDQSCDEPINTILIDNEVSSGTLVILYGEGSRKLKDFTSEDSSTDWVADSILVMESGATFRDLLKATATNEATSGTAGVVVYERNAAEQFAGVRFNLTAAAGTQHGFIEQSAYAGNEFGNILAPGGRARYLRHGMVRRMIMDVHIEVVVASNNLSGLVGYESTSGAANYPYGFGFGFSKAMSNNWFAACINFGGAAFPWPEAAVRNLWVDLGVDATTQFHKLDFRFGTNGSGPFAEWWIDSVLRHRITSLPAFPDWGTTAVGRGIRLLKHAVADQYNVRILNPIRSMHRFE